MNIVHLLAYPGDGGAEKYALYLSDAAKKSGHEVTFVLGSEGPLLEKLQIANYKLQIIKMPSWYSVATSLKLKKYFTENDTQIVHTHFLREHFLAVGAKILGAKIKVVRTVHRMDQFPKKVRPFYSLVQTRTDAFIAISRYLKGHIVKNGINESRVSVIYNGVPEICIKKKGNSIGYLGRLSSEKGIVNFIESNKENFRNKAGNAFLIAGDGPDSEKIKLQISGYKLPNVELLGSINNLDSLFEKASVLVLPSETEVMPLVVLEAYSAGIPVISFDLEALEEIINPKFMVKKGDYVGLYKLANRVSEEDYSAELRGIYREKFSVNNMWQETESLYKSLLD